MGKNWRGSKLTPEKNWEHQFIHLADFQSRGHSPRKKQKMVSIDVIDETMAALYASNSGSVFTVYAGETILLKGGGTYHISTGIRVREMNPNTIAFLSPHGDATMPHLMVAPMVMDRPGKL